MIRKLTYAVCIQAYYCIKFAESTARFSFRLKIVGCMYTTGGSIYHGGTEDTWLALLLIGIIVKTLFFVSW